jgi:hypothetical protein
MQSCWGPQLPRTANSLADAGALQVGGLGRGGAHQWHKNLHSTGRHLVCRWKAEWGLDGPSGTIHFDAHYSYRKSPREGVWTGSGLLSWVVCTVQNLGFLVPHTILLLLSLFYCCLTWQQPSQRWGIVWCLCYPESGIWEFSARSRRPLAPHGHSSPIEGIHL